MTELSYGVILLGLVTLDERISVECYIGHLIALLRQGEKAEAVEVPSGCTNERNEIRDKRGFPGESILDGGIYQ